MTKEQINSLVTEGEFPEPSNHRELIETHISWVIVCDRFVYKIKKPVHYSFLDFSTFELRKHFCEREIELNRRLTNDIYLDVQEIHEWKNTFAVGGEKGTIIDHTVRMNKVDREKQMDVLLMKNKVTNDDIYKLAEKIALFHKNTGIIKKRDFLDIQQKFNDLGDEKKFLQEAIGISRAEMISRAINASDSFLLENRNLLAQRARDGYFRDCHGDLHSRNIFLLANPQPFDCIEFNDEFRQIDVLNEVAFLCMDLDAFGRHDLSSLFIKHYNQFFPNLATDAERRLFIYYKTYRANIRAKVNSLRAKTAATDTDKTKALNAADKYLLLMNSYIDSLAITV